MTPLCVTPATARRFQRRATLLDAPAADVAAALAHLGYIQIDPINVCGRMHDHILRHRVAGYREGDLMRHLHGDATPKPAAQRTAFEHHIPSTNTLVAFPLEAWPHLRAGMRRRTYGSGSWSGRLSPRQRELSTRILAEIAARGPLGSEDFDDDRSARAVWGSASLVKATLQKLFFHGCLLIAYRSDTNRRLYDLPGRVLPVSVLARPEPAKKETARWDALLKLRQRRLVLLKRAELALVTDLVQLVELAGTGCPPLAVQKSDLPLLESCAAGDPAPVSADPLLLAPLDPLIYDRRITRALWDFDYTWEAYTPPAMRKRGHYALPILAGTEIVGHVDPKADRPARRLRVASRSVRRGHRVAGALDALARFLGLRR